MQSRVAHAIVRFTAALALIGAFAGAAQAEPAEAARRPVARNTARPAPTPIARPTHATLGRSSASTEASLGWARHHVLSDAERGTLRDVVRSAAGAQTRTSRAATVRLQLDTRARALLRRYDMAEIPGGGDAPVRFEGEAGRTAEHYGYRLGGRSIRVSAPRRGVASLRPMARRIDRVGLLHGAEVEELQRVIDAGADGTDAGRARVIDAVRRLDVHRRAREVAASYESVDAGYAETEHLTSELTWQLGRFAFEGATEIELRFSRGEEGAIDLETPGLSDLDADRIARAIGAEGAFRRGIENRLVAEGRGTVVFRVRLGDVSRSNERTASDARIVD